MNLHRFATPSVHHAVLTGDLESDAAIVLSALPMAMQEQALARIKTQSDSPSASQLVSTLDHMSVNLSKAEFDTTPCKSCLHHTDNAKRLLGFDFKPNHCLYALCAQRDAMAKDLLSRRTVLKAEDLEPSQHAIADEAPQLSDDMEMFPDPMMDVGVPVEATGSVELDQAQDPQAIEQHTFEVDTAMPLSEGIADPVSDGAQASLDVAVNDQPQAKLADSDGKEESSPSYVELVREKWWRNALKCRLAENASKQDMQSFLLACLGTGHYPSHPFLQDSPVALFGTINTAGYEDALGPMVAMLIDEIPLTVVRGFLKLLQVNLLDTGRVTSKLMSHLGIDELGSIADELEVPNTEAICDAYDAGPHEFAEAICSFIGEDRLNSFVPPSLRP
jgi:hypothetical protein